VLDLPAVHCFCNRSTIDLQWNPAAGFDLLKVAETPPRWSAASTRAGVKRPAKSEWRALRACPAAVFGPVDLRAFFAFAARLRRRSCAAPGDGSRGDGGETVEERRGHDDLLCVRPPACLRWSHKKAKAQE